MGNIVQKQSNFRITNNYDIEQQRVDEAFDKVLEAMNELDKGLEKFNHDLRQGNLDEDLCNFQY